MREILFRGKEKNSGEWIYGDLRHISDGHGGYILCIVDNTNGRNNDVIGVEVVPGTVGQYTGLTGKNGAKIFEGDIVEILTKNEEIEVVEYDDGGFEVKADGFTVDFHTNIYSTDLEVIGNIHNGGVNNSKSSK